MAKPKEVITLRQKIVLAILLLVGTITLSLTMFRSGLAYKGTLGFWGPNGHDGIWHLALINQVGKTFPPENPVFGGSKLGNYHYGFDLIVKIISLVLPLPVSVIYFQITPPLLALFLGLLSFWVGFLWQRRFWVGFWLTFLNYFAGSAGFLVTLIRDGRIGGESLFWSMQSASTLINPPFALSLIMLLLGFSWLVRWQKLSWPKVIVLGLLSGFMVGIKSYAAAVSGVGLFFWALAERKNGKKPWLVVVLAGGCSLLLLKMIGVGGNVFLFRPFWLIHSMLESPDRFYWPKLAVAIHNLTPLGVGLKLIVAELVGLFIFLIGNLGTRMTGVFLMIGNLRRQKAAEWWLFGIGLAGVLPPLLLAQKGTPWNIIQFFYYFLFAANFYLAVFLSRLTVEKKYFLLAVMVLLTVPTTCGTLDNYLGFPAPAGLPAEERSALSFLRLQPGKVVLTYPYYKSNVSATPVPLYRYETTAYVSAYSEKISFLEDEMNLEITGFPWRERKKEVEDFFTTTDIYKARGFLINNRIDYLYLLDGQRTALDANRLETKMIFSNEKVKIYQVLR